MALKSMTGFGSGRSSRADLEVNVDIRAVNHRYCDVVVRMPADYQMFEQPVAKRVRELVARGRVEVTVSRKPLKEEGDPSLFNETLWRQYCESLRGASRIAEDVFGSRFAQAEPYFLGQALASGLGRRELQATDTKGDSESDELPLVLDAANAAIAALVAARVEEGKRLEQELTEQLDRLRTVHGAVSQRAGDASERTRKRLQGKMTELLSDGSIQQDRLLTEVALIAERSDITEEIVRWQSHMASLSSLFVSSEPVGKRLDFLIQELVREVNTVGSKCQDYEISSLVIEAKALLEKIREQIQNVE